MSIITTSSFQSQLSVLLGAILPEAILEAMLIPLYPFIVRLLLPESPDVGYYTGLFSSAFYMPLFVMNILWGATSDRIGRKVCHLLLI
jgi:MFS family permease